MNPAVTYVCFVRDHSGSMSEPIGGLDKTGNKLKKEIALSSFNEQLEVLKRESNEDMETLVTVVEFDDDINSSIENENVHFIKHLNSYWTGGSTALYDAIAHAIKITTQAMDDDNRDNKAAIVIIQTDGMENASVEYNGNKGRLAINKMIKALESTQKWTFTFLGENIDKEVAISMGIAQGNIMSYKITDTVHAYSTQETGMANYMAMRKTGALNTTSFYQEEEKK